MCSPTGILVCSISATTCELPLFPGVLLCMIFASSFVFFLVSKCYGRAVLQYRPGKPAKAQFQDFGNMFPECCERCPLWRAGKITCAPFWQRAGNFCDRSGFGDQAFDHDTSCATFDSFSPVTASCTRYFVFHPADLSPAQSRGRSGQCRCPFRDTGHHFVFCLFRRSIFAPPPQSS